MVTDAGFQNSGSTNRTDIYTENKARTDHYVTANAISGINKLNKALDENKPVIVALNHTLKYQKKTNWNKASDHYVVVVARFYDKDVGVPYYLFYDPWTSSKTKVTSE